MNELSRHCLCDNCDGEDCKDLPHPKFLYEATLQELKAEMLKRGGIVCIHVSDKSDYQIMYGRKGSQTRRRSIGNGKADIIVIKPQVHP